ncbi:MAG: ethanolamine utilization protein [Candidatus Berkelbacteria bacterium Licking1014_2]|uniref:Phosphate propanoyltransferase n=1 Tax=Candidatus Berkelbacteria bacterium Licking1014_2 TaxID=2017146 RepID=A0A554LW12_9BACT|nr:MAG: ethanolamine utilization protein [Candidatus Berkelbacteria bacterium Licking1014_2]
MEREILIETSARHVHLSSADKDQLFGQNYQWQKLRDLSQPGMFAAAETVVLKNGAQEMVNVRVVGPEREKTQVELSLSDAKQLDIEPPLKMSGEWQEDEPAEITIIGPRGQIKIHGQAPLGFLFRSVFRLRQSPYLGITKKAVIIAQRHLHLNPTEAKELNLTSGQTVKIAVNTGGRRLVFDDVACRVNDDFKLACHLDTDEANAAGIEGNANGILII